MSVTNPSATKNPTVAAALSLVIPGAGQLYLGARNVALAVFGTAVGLAFLIWFCLENFGVGETILGTFETSWLWLLLAVFWLWNVWDAFQRGYGRMASRLLAFLIPVLITYVIAWDVTNINLERLVLRAGNAGLVLNDIFHPDLLTRDTVTQQGGTSIFVPCSNPPQTVPAGGASGHPVGIDKICGTVGDPVVIAGQGFLANETGNVYWTEYGGTNEVQVRANNAPLLVTTDAEGKFVASFNIPTFAGRDGLDPANPVVQGIDVRFVQEVGPLKPSENFKVIIGEIVPVPAPSWMVSLGLVPAGATVPWVKAGGIFVTIALGLLATIISVAVAAPLSFLGAHNIMGKVRGGTVIYYLARGFFNILRSIDTVILAVIFVTWTGLGTLTGLLALTIHSIAAVAKLYSEEVEHIDPGPVEASTAVGGNLLQNIRFAVIPQIIPSFLAYSLLRWDINMRSATVVGLVSAAGVGFYIFESIRKGGYREYAAALWSIAVVVLIVDYLSSYWRQQILVNTAKVSPEPPKPFYKTRRGIVYTVALILVFVVSWNLAGLNLRSLLDGAPTFLGVLGDYVTIDLSGEVWTMILRNMIITIFQALLATTLGAIMALPFAFLGARNITGRTRATAWIYYVARFILSFMRSIEAVLYVAVFVFWVGVGPFAGMLALSITTFGLIGKLFSEAVENIEEGPVEALLATGANRLQSIAYAVVPQIVPPFISYAIYQWDINIRLATILAIAGGAGIGQVFLNYNGQLQYHKAGAVVLAIVIVVALMDFASAKIRERLV